MALASQPTLLLSNEPTGTLDSAEGAEVMALYPAPRTPPATQRD
jgi:ABC-type lipoprotein export system ATPase subunit